MNIYIYCLPMNETHYVKYAEIGLKRLGHTVHNKMDLHFQKNKEGYTLQNFDEIKYIKEQKIDLLLFYGFSFMNHFVNQEGCFLPEETKLPYIVIWHDNPLRYLYHLSFLKDTNHHFFCCDSQLSQDMVSYGFKCDWAPTFFCSDYQTAGESKTELTCDLSFAGSMFKADGLLKNRIGKNKAERFLLDKLIKDRIPGKYLNYTKKLDETLDIFDGRFGDVAFCNILEQKFLLRTEVFDALREFPIHLYGQGELDNARYPNIIKNGNLDQQTQLPDLYRSTKIGLSIELLPASVHQRIMECLGCNGFMMFEEKEDNAKCFSNIYKEVEWKSLNELRDKVKFFLENENERIRIKNILHKEALERHDCHHRMKEVLKIYGR